MRTSLVIGAGGQDGILLADLLARRGDQVICVGHRKTWRAPTEELAAVDILQPEPVFSLIKKTRPHECYYLPAFHHSAEDAGLRLDDLQLFEHSHAVHVRGLLHFLNGIAQANLPTRLFYAASSHVFGTPEIEPQNESTPLNPENVYGITKATGIHCCRHFRRERGVFAATGILFNHESHLRPVKFLSQKIVHGVLTFQKDNTKKLALGDMGAVVDWGYAGDYVEAMTRILNHTLPEDFIVATGEPHTVGEFLQTACEIVGVDWQQCAVTNAGLLKKKPVRLIGDSTKLRRLTGWQPKISFRKMVEEMLEHARKNGS